MYNRARIHRTLRKEERKGKKGKGGEGGKPKEERQRLQLTCRGHHMKGEPHEPTHHRPISKKTADLSAKLCEKAKKGNKAGTDSNGHFKPVSHDTCVRLKCLCLLRALQESPWAKHSVLVSNLIFCEVLLSMENQMWVMVPGETSGGDGWVE